MIGVIKSPWRSLTGIPPFEGAMTVIRLFATETRLHARQSDEGQLNGANPMLR
jgi:hypothetical protein